MLYSQMSLGELLDLWRNAGPLVYGGYNDQDKAHLVYEPGVLPEASATLVMRVPDETEEFKDVKEVLDKVDELATPVIVILEGQDVILTISN